MLGKIAVLPNGCWEWQGATDENGYGRVGVGYRMYLAHRVVWLLLRGEFPAGLEPDHTCRYPSCVNPDCLEWVTRRENFLRGDAPIARAHRAGVCLRGHEMTPENTVNRKDGQRQCRTCVRESERRRAERRRKDGAAPRDRSATPTC